jgi:hypothetical protein
MAVSVHSARSVRERTARGWAQAQAAQPCSSVSLLIGLLSSSEAGDSDACRSVRQGEPSAKVLLSPRRCWRCSLLTVHLGYCRRGAAPDKRILVWSLALREGCYYDNLGPCLSH